MKVQAKKQYTIRGVSPAVDSALRHKARVQGKSLNVLLVEALTKTAGAAGESIIFHELDDLIGQWQEDPEFDRAIELQDQVEQKLWQ